MPWLSIVMAIVTFFLAGGSEKENRGRALVAAGLAGAATYYVSHETEWGQRNLGEFDGVTVKAPNDADSSPVADQNGQPYIGSDGKPIRVPLRPDGREPSSGFWSTLTSWGAAGTAAVVGVGGAVASGDAPNWLLLGGLAVAAIVILK